MSGLDRNTHKKTKNDPSQKLRSVHYAQSQPAEENVESVYNLVLPQSDTALNIKSFDGMIVASAIWQLSARATFHNKYMMMNLHVYNVNSILLTLTSTWIAGIKPHQVRLRLSQQPSSVCPGHLAPRIAVDPRILF